MNQSLEEAPITTWDQFTEKIRLTDREQLKTLDEFPNAVLVTGCQRSGTTMLSRIITQSEGMVNYWFGRDDELDAALILAGINLPPSPGRYCFQTTYLSGHYWEYYEHHGAYKIIWVLRNPYSVVTSLLYNWKPSSLMIMFKRFAAPQLKGLTAMLYKLFGVKAICRTQMACEIYRLKTMQLLELYATLDQGKILIVEYDDLVLNKASVLPKIYNYIDLDYKPAYQEMIHSKSVNKKSRLTARQIRLVRRIAEPVYQQALALKNSRH
jgi:hypothetical protein